MSVDAVIEDHSAKDVIQCEGCKKCFSKKPRDSRTRRFCSHKCYLGFAKLEKHPCFQDDAVEVSCANCDVRFRVSKCYEGKKRFCTSECWRAFQKQHPKNGIGSCIECGTVFRKLKLSQVFCCRSCQAKHCRDDKSPTWKGGAYVSSQGHIVVRTEEKRTSGSNAGRAVYRGSHRVLVESVIGRRLDAQEKVWHIDRDKTNNSIENLFIFRSQVEIASAIGKKNLPTKSNIVVQ